MSPTYELRVDVGETFRACEFAGAHVRRDIGSAWGKVRVRLGTAPPQSLFFQKNEYFLPFWKPPSTAKMCLHVCTPRNSAL